MFEENEKYIVVENNLLGNKENDNMVCFRITAYDNDDIGLSECVENIFYDISANLGSDRVVMYENMYSLKKIQYKRLFRKEKNVEINGNCKLNDVKKMLETGIIDDCVFADVWSEKYPIMPCDENKGAYKYFVVVQKNIDIEIFRNMDMTYSGENNAVYGNGITIFPHDTIRTEKNNTETVNKYILDDNYMAKISCDIVLPRIYVELNKLYISKESFLNFTERVVEKYGKKLMKGDYK